MLKASVNHPFIKPIFSMCSHDDSQCLFSHMGKYNDVSLQQGVRVTIQHGQVDVKRRQACPAPQEVQWTLAYLV